MPLEEGPNVAFLASYPPRHCGIAEFTADEIRAVHTGLEDFLVFPIDKDNSAYLPPIEWRHVVNQMDSSDYKRVANLVRELDAVAKANEEKRWIAHAEQEFGLDGDGRDNNFNTFGKTLKEAGINSFIRLHTVIDPKLFQLEDFQKNITKEFEKNYSMICVMTPSAKKVLTSEPYNMDPKKIVYMPHGTYTEWRLESKKAKKRRFGIEGTIPIGTPGMVSKGKGLEFSLQGFALYLDSIEQSERDLTNYYIYGGTHPEVLRANNWKDPYRNSLMNLAEELKLNPIEIFDQNINQQKNLDLKNNKVIFVNNHIDRNVLEEFFQAIDVGITTYLNPTQCSSGIGAKLAGYAVPCVSTKFMFHNDLFKNENGEIDNSGYLIKFRNKFPMKLGVPAKIDPDDIAEGIKHVIEYYQEMRSKIISKGINMNWRVFREKQLLFYEQLAA